MGQLNFTDTADITMEQFLAAGDLQVAGTPVSDVAPVPVQQAALSAADNASATGTHANVPASVSAVILQSSTGYPTTAPTRLGWTVFNDSASPLYVKCGSGASAVSFTFKCQPYASWELPPAARYQGIITGIWETATGTARVCEFS